MKKQALNEVKSSNLVRCRHKWMRVNSGRPTGIDSDNDREAHWCEECGKLRFKIWKKGWKFPEPVKRKYHTPNDQDNQR